MIPSPPNILLIMCDDLGFGDVGFNGPTPIQTPHLDQLAKSSLRLTRFYAGGPVCSPTRGTCLTGRHYTRYGINHANAGRLPTHEITLASLCRDQGYRTGHFGKWHMGTLTTDGSDGNRGGSDPRLFSPPWLHGFDTCFSTESKVPTWDPMITPDEDGPRGKRWGQPGNPYGTHYWNESGEKVTENLEGCDCRAIVDRAEPFIRKAVEEQTPFLSAVWFHAPHTPVVAGPEWLAMYPNATPEQQHYYGCVSAMDAQVGRLAGLLDELKVKDNTIIWFCSDNGPETARHSTRNHGSTGGLRGMKRSLYEGGVGVPALFHWPEKFPHEATITSPMSTLDILPTCCAAMGLEPPDDRPIDGLSVLPQLANDAIERPAPIPYRFLDSECTMAGSPTFALTDNRWKFLTNLDTNGTHDQLYDMVEDRFETTDVLKDHPEKATIYRDQLTTFMESCRRSHAGDDYHEPVDMITPFQEPGGWAD